MITNSDILAVGRLGKPHGTRGEINLLVDDDIIFDLSPAFLVLTLDGINVPFVVDSLREKGSDLLVRFKDYTTEDRQRPLLGAAVAVLKRDLPTDYEERLPADSLIGYSVVDDQLGILGTLTDIDDSTSNLLANISRDDHTELIIPLHDDFIVSIDEKNKQIITSLPEGLV